MARSLKPSIHNVAPDDIEVRTYPDQAVVLGLLNAGPGSQVVADLYIAGDTDRERLENLLAIACRIRQGALDLIAQLATDDVTEVHTALGHPLPLPDAAPLTGQTVTAVPA